MRRRTGYPLVPAALLTAALLLSAGCLTPGGEGPRDGGTGTSPLEGTSWDLVSYRDVEGTMTGVIPATRVTAVFSAGGKLGGTAGCNHYSGAYAVDGTSLTVGQAGMTLMACPDPGVMDQEGRYLSLLGSAARFRTDGDRLVLSDSSGNEILIFGKYMAPEPLPLTGTIWILESLSTGMGGISTVLAGTTIDATFSGDGKVTGSAGCNRYFAGYTLNGTSLRFGPVGATKMFCGEPAGLMEQEQTYLSLLTTVESYRTEGNRLTLLDGSGSMVLSFRAA